MKNLKEITTTHHGDYKGVVSIDRQDAFFDSINSLNLPDGVIVGFGFNFAEIRGVLKLEDVEIYFYLALPEYGATIQEIISLGVSNIKVNKVSRRIPVEELGKYIKNFDCCGIYNELNIDAFEVL